MQQRMLVLVASVLVLCGCSGAEDGDQAAQVSQAATVPAGFIDETVVTGLASPTAMAFAPDGRLFVCQQGGALRVIRDDVLLSTPFVQLSVNSVGERGLLGVALDPNFTSNQFVYLYYTAPTPSVHNRISRFTANGDVAVPGSEVVLMDLPNLGATNHNGGALHFGPDGKLYISVGENAVGSNAQSLSSPLGKMLRINSDGSIPSDNPFFNQTTGINRAIWARGLRNPFTFGFQPTTGVMFINDVGQNTWEEINQGASGANYGWPTTEGPTTNPNFVSPIHAYNHNNEPGVCAIVGAAFYNPPVQQFPNQFVGDYFFADFCAGWIRRRDAGSAVFDFASGLPNPVDLRTGADGALYYLTRGGGGAVGRVRHSSAEPPSVTQHPVNLTRALGQSATFSVGATGSEPLGFQWQRNGADISGATSSSFTIASVSSSDNGDQFRARVNNAFGSVFSNSATLTVTDNDPPSATILSPDDGTSYGGGQVFTFSGTGDDPEQGSLPPSAFEWLMVFHHDDHTHPFLDFQDVSSGTFAIPQSGETATNVFFRIHLTVTDAGGLQDSTFVDIVPRTSTITLQTNPNGLQVTLDGIPATAPFSTNSVEGIVRQIGTPQSQMLGGSNFVFDSWSDGGGLEHDVATPVNDTTFTANFVESSCASGEIEFGGHCYFVLDTAQGYDAALGSCQARGAGWSLAEITSSAENDFVSNLIGGGEHWLGGTDRAVEGAWLWESGPQFWSGGINGNPVGGLFTNFLAGQEPNDAGNSDCLRMIGGGAWRDITCGSNFAAVCESDTLTGGASCNDSVQNGDESDVDCGGSCPACANGDSCNSNSDCQSGSCDASGVCVAGCAFGEVEFSGHCYFLINASQNYDTALGGCEARGAGWSLAEVTSSSENDFVAGLIGNSERWLGGTDRAAEGAWVWESGPQFWSGGINGNPVGGLFTSFLAGQEPNDAGNSDCLRMIAGGAWRDIQCGGAFGAVCESATN